MYVLLMLEKEDNLQIVCGAPNVDAGQYVIVAKLELHYLELN